MYTGYYNVFHGQILPLCTSTAHSQTCGLAHVALARYKNSDAHILSLVLARLAECGHGATKTSTAHSQTYGLAHVALARYKNRDAHILSLVLARLAECGHLYFCSACRNTQKEPTPRLVCPQNRFFEVHRQGLEPWTP